MENKKGYCLVSQQIRDLIRKDILVVPEKNLELHGEDSVNSRKGWFKDEKLESRVQPGSFDPSVGDEFFIIDTERHGLIRGERKESIYRTLLQLPSRHRLRRDITDGYELKVGFTYLVPLNEKIKLVGIDSVRSSPKSSTGRLFPKTRLLSDYNPSFDEIHFSNENPLDLWLIIQPLAFNFILHPGDNLNQLRFFVGDPKLTSNEMIEETKRGNLLYKKTKDGGRVPLDILPWMISDGLQLTLDLEGHDTHNVIGLRARRNPDPIDLSRKNFYKSEDYFDPIVNKNGEKVSVQRGEHYIFASQEIISVPEHLSAELRRHSREGLEGRSHDAGFVDQGFIGDMDFEITPEEETKILLSHEMPLSKLDFFRTLENTDKLYGSEIGSNYQGQIGPRVSKHLKKFDFESAARNHDKLSRIVLVQEARILRSFRQASEGFEPIRPGDREKLMFTLENGFFHSRYDCEEDELVLQEIPYVILFREGEVFSYIRTESKKDYGDVRLLGKHSIGVGGHVTKEDAPNYIERCLEREATIEEVKFEGQIGKPKLMGTLFSKVRPVDRVHYGLIYAIHTDGNVVSNEASIAKAEFVPIKDMKVDYYPNAETETWSRILIPHLEGIYELSRMEDNYLN